ncbi:hypothetical protein BAUCODRAFT_35767, partial [Baudoinia panamericana UAMH 10762]
MPNFLNAHTLFFLGVLLAAIPIPLGVWTDHYSLAFPHQYLGIVVCDSVGVNRKDCSFQPFYRRTNDTNIAKPLYERFGLDLDWWKLQDISTASIANSRAMPRTPVYFVSHGGPTIMEETSHPAYAKLQAIGREITQEVKPKAVVVFSAHWQADGPNAVEVNTATDMDLIYDFYGFPAHYYKMQYPHRGSPQLAGKVIETFRKNGVHAEGVSRGLDHGVWAGFMVMFDPKTNPLNVPIVQVSLYDSEDPERHYALGQALSSLRDEGVQIIGSGMAVHNLRDLGRRLGGSTNYAVTFEDGLKAAVETKPEERREAMTELLKRPDARKAHPSFEHLLPVHVVAGAAGGESGKQLWTMAEGGLAWGQYRFGEVVAS